MNTGNNFTARILLLFTLLGTVFLTSCGGDDDDDDDAALALETFEVALNSSNAIPAVTDRSETGNITMTLFDDNSLEFTITVNSLSSSDELTAAHVHGGDLVSTGGVEIALVDGTDIVFSGSTATGTIALTAAQIATLQGSDVYVNVHSTESPAGLIRGQIDETIDNAYNVSLSPSNAVPPIVGRNEEGSAYFRIVGNTMYFKVAVTGLDATDAITAGHIHEGSSTVTGGVLIGLDITDGAQLEVTKSVVLTGEELTKVNNDELYVNIHSTQQPGGLLRGQIR